MSKIAMLTVHTAASKRKVDFHFWSKACIQQKMEVRFLSVGFSMITKLIKRGKQYYPPYNSWQHIHKTFYACQWQPIFHPFRLPSRLLTKLSIPLFRLYPKLLPERIWKGLEGTDIFIIENGAGLLLIPQIKQRFPHARIIYSVCDRIKTLNYHPLILQAEEEGLPLIDMIRVPAEVMLADYPQHPNVQYIPHGLQTSLFDSNMPNPYSKPQNVISVGDMLFDANAIMTMAKAFPDHTFHLFGRNAKLPKQLENVIVYGEQPFDVIAPYIKHADIGLAPYHLADNADYLSQSSLKMIQYTYCKLPIVAPAFAATGRSHVCSYQPDNNVSIISAMQRAINYNRQLIDNSEVLSWDESLYALLHNGKRQQVEKNSLTQKVAVYS